MRNSTFTWNTGLYPMESKCFNNLTSRTSFLEEHLNDLSIRIRPYLKSSSSDISSSIQSDSRPWIRRVGLMSSPS